MNKKGFTLIELVVSIALITMIVIPTFAVILNFKNRQQIASDKQELIKFKNLITSDIEDDVLQYGVNNVEKSTDCDIQDTTQCTIIMTFGNGDIKNLIINTKNKTIKYNEETYTLAVPYADIMTENDMKTHLQQGYLDYNVYDDKNISIFYFRIIIPITYVNDTDDVESLNYGISIVAEKQG